MKLVFALALLTFATGLVSCATPGHRCIAVPLSAKVSDRELELCRSAVRQHPGRRDLLQHYSQLLAIRGRYETLVTISRAALQRDTRSAEAHFFLAVALRKLGHCREAIAEYHAYAALRRDDPDPYFGIGLCEQQRGNRTAALSAFQIYLSKEDRSEREGWRRQARAKAEALMEPVAPTPPPEPIASPPSPIPDTDCGAQQRAIAADPFDTAAYDRYASCAFRLGKHADMVRYLRTALRDNPDYARGWWHLGRAQRALGNDKSAGAALARACAAGISEACP